MMRPERRCRQVDVYYAALWLETFGFASSFQQWGLIIAFIMLLVFIQVHSLMLLKEREQLDIFPLLPENICNVCLFYSIRFHL